MPLIFRKVIAIKLFELESGAEKMIVVHNGVLNARRPQIRRKLRLPYPFRKPRAARARLKMFFDVIRKARYLRITIFGRNHRENGFVESAADDFHLALRDELTELFEIFRMRALHPFQ